MTDSILLNQLFSGETGEIDRAEYAAYGEAYARFYDDEISRAELQRELARIAADSEVARRIKLAPTLFA